MWEIGVHPQRPHQQVKHLHLLLEHQEPLILHLKMEEVHREGESMIQRLVSACTQWGWTDVHTNSPEPAGGQKGHQAEHHPHRNP